MNKKMERELCSFELCNKPTTAKGLCRSHYAQAYRGRELTSLGSTPTSHFKAQIGDTVLGGYTVIDMGYWIGGAKKWKTWYYICEHSCGRIRRFTAPKLLKEKQPCKLCEAGKLRMKETEYVVLQAEYRKYKSHINRTGRANEITQEDWIALVKSPCEYCGSEPHGERHLPSNRRIDGRKPTAFLGGIDRIDSSLGYIISNVVSCCWECNRSKNNMSIEEWLNQIEHLATRAEAIREKYGIK